MRVCFLIILSVFFTKDVLQCQEIKLENIQIEYRALSRNYFVLIRLDNQSTQKTSNRNETSFLSRSYSRKEKKCLQKHLQHIDWEEIISLKAPSEERLFDGAATASLKIRNKEKVYHLKSFDHGNPPKEIKPLINYILSLAESIE